jgi:transposase
MQYLGIDWGTRKAAWCSINDHGDMAEGAIPADEDGLAKLVHTLGPDVRGCVEMMSGAVWVRDRLAACGWEIQIAEPRKVKALAPLACKTDRVDARVLAELVRRELVPELFPEGGPRAVSRYDWGTRKAAWCSINDHGDMAEGVIPADEDGLARLVHTVGLDVRGCVEMMSGAVWVRDRLAACGWEIQIAEPRKVKALAPLACKTDRVDARVLAELVRRELVPELWVPALSERELRERLRRRSHLVRLPTSATNRAFGLLTQWGLRVGLTTLRKPGAIELLSERGVPQVWLQSIKTLLSVIDDLDRQITPIERELRPLAHDDEQVRLLMTIPGVAELLGLTLLAEIGDVSRPASRQPR